MGVGGLGSGCLGLEFRVQGAWVWSGLGFRVIASAAPREGLGVDVFFGRVGEEES